jgi:hypothetical protein
MICANELEEGQPLGLDLYGAPIALCVDCELVTFQERQEWLDKQTAIGTDTPPSMRESES